MSMRSVRRSGRYLNTDEATRLPKEQMQPAAQSVADCELARLPQWGCCVDGVGARVGRSERTDIRLQIQRFNFPNTND